MDSCGSKWERMEISSEAEGRVVTRSSNRENPWRKWQSTQSNGSGKWRNVRHPQWERLKQIFNTCNGTQVSVSHLDTYVRKRLHSSPCSHEETASGMERGWGTIEDLGVWGWGQKKITAESGPIFGLYEPWRLNKLKPKSCTFATLHIKAESLLGHKKPKTQSVCGQNHSGLWTP